MQVGDLVRHTPTGQIWVITALADSELVGDGEYVEVLAQWLIPKEHLEVICK